MDIPRCTRLTTLWTAPVSFLALHSSSTISKELLLARAFLYLPKAWNPGSLRGRELYNNLLILSLPCGPPGSGPADEFKRTCERSHRYVPLPSPSTPKYRAHAHKIRYTLPLASPHINVRIDSLNSKHGPRFLRHHGQSPGAEAETAEEVRPAMTSFDLLCKLRIGNLLAQCMLACLGQEICECWFPGRLEEWKDLRWRFAFHAT